MFTMLKNIRRDKSGATAIEYGLIAALLGIAIIGGVGAAGGKLDTLFDDISTKLQITGTTTTP